LLRLAREQAGLTLDEAARGAGVASAEAEAFESGALGDLHDRVETLRALRAYADSIELPGGDYALAAINLWPPVHQLPTRAPDSGGVPVVSVSSAPAGRHSPAGLGGLAWPADRTGAADFSITGVVSPIGPLPLHDTGVVPAFATGEVPVVRTSAPFVLKVLVSAAALLVVLGIFALAEHSHFSGWAKSARADASRWIDDVKGTSTPAAKKSSHTASTSAGKKTGLPKVTVVGDPATAHITINVSAPSFGVKLLAFKAPTWVEVTDSGHLTPVYQEVLPANQSYNVPITHTVTIETGASSARLYMYDGLRFIGLYFPKKAPFTITLNAVG
jgi:hypothetical protein